MFLKFLRFLPLLGLSVVVHLAHGAGEAPKGKISGGGGQGTPTESGALALTDLVSAPCHWSKGIDFAMRLNYFPRYAFLNTKAPSFARALYDDLRNLNVCEQAKPLNTGALPQLQDPFTEYKPGDTTIAIRVNRSLFVDTNALNLLLEEHRPTLILHELMHAFLVEGPDRMTRLKSFVDYIASATAHTDLVEMEQQADFAQFAKENPFRSADGTNGAQYFLCRASVDANAAWMNYFVQLGSSLDLRCNGERGSVSPAERFLQTAPVTHGSSLDNFFRDPYLVNHVMWNTWSTSPPGPWAIPPKPNAYYFTDNQWDWFSKMETTILVAMHLWDHAAPAASYVALERVLEQNGAYAEGTWPKNATDGAKSWQDVEVPVKTYHGCPKQTANPPADRYGGNPYSNSDPYGAYGRRPWYPTCKPYSEDTGNTVTQSKMTQDENRMALFRQKRYPMMIPIYSVYAAIVDRTGYGTTTLKEDLQRITDTAVAVLTVVIERARPSQDEMSASCKLAATYKIPALVALFKAHGANCGK